MYQVIQRSTTSYLMDAEGNPGEGETLAHGGEWSDEDLYSALVECDARNLMEGEGKPRWTVEDDGETVEDLECEAEHVYDALLSLGVISSDAERMIG